MSKDTIEKTITLLTDRDNERIFQSGYVKQSVDETFHQAFARYVDESSATKEEIELVTGVSKASIYRYISLKDDTLPDTDTLILLCVGLRLYYQRSMYLFYLAGRQLNSQTEKYRICEYFLHGCAFREDMTVYSLNELLAERGFETLGKGKSI
ncbi:hypothetical protein [Ruminococcus sp.]|uniref:hypothetical protein n=1 Tax=Ruminococcus sp. TaxID=41978 RepID=UPI0025E934F3|nr:hypothetical protein [Ruminococcus sp.]MBQ8966717.1 hypothetical protein [Ruminococcus sp.]